jgi:hypothetical protein
VKVNKGEGNTRIEKEQAKEMSDGYVIANLDQTRGWTYYCAICFSLHAQV